MKKNEAKDKLQNIEKASSLNDLTMLQLCTYLFKHEHFETIDTATLFLYKIFD